MASTHPNGMLLKDVFRSHPSLEFCTLLLSEKTLTIELSDSQKTEELNVRDIIGSESTIKKRSKLENSGRDVAAYLRIYSYPLTLCNSMFSKCVGRQRKVHNFCMCKFDTYRENADVVEQWSCVITWLLRGKIQFLDGNAVSIPDSLPSTHKLLLIVNPYGGSGKALQIYKEQVAPMFIESGTQYDLLITERVNCARDYVRVANLSQWDGIAMVSGDGILFEVFNGLMERDDWATAVKTPVGVIPGGSGNALAKTISNATGEPYDTKVVTTSILNVIRGRLSPLDLVQIQTASRPPIYSFLSVGWGLMADIDIESERIRAIGEARFHIWALYRAISLRKYKGKLSYLPVTGYQPELKKNAQIKNDIHSRVSRAKTMNGRLTQSNNDVETNHELQKNFLRSKSMINEKNNSLGTNNCNGVQLLNFNYTDDVFTSSSTTQSSSKNSWSEQNGNSTTIKDHYCEAIPPKNEKKLPDEIPQTKVNLPLLNEVVPEDWIIIEDDFVSVYVCHQTHLNSLTLFAPDSKMDDGIMWLAVLRAGVSRAQVITYLSSLQNAEHLNLPFAEFMPILAFRLEPSENEGIITIDGEVVPCEPIQGAVLPSAARIMTC